MNESYFCLFPFAFFLFRSGWGHKENGVSRRGEDAMRFTGSLLTSLLVLTLAGCGAVYVTQPIGEKPCKIKAKDWEGTWIHKDGSVTVRVMDGENGQLRIAWIEPKENGLTFETHNVQLREAGSWMFANIKDDANTNEPRYLWARIKGDGNQVIVWLPDPAKFRALVEEQKFPGRIEGKSDVILDTLELKHLRIIAGEQEGILFVWEEPVVFLRFTREGD
jgi:hypothetical protein